MAKTPSNEYFTPIKKRTSIGRSSRTRPKNKHKRRQYRKYRGQGYGTKAVELRESWAFDTLSLSKLSLITRRKDFWINREYKIDTESGQPEGKYLMYKYSPLRKETNE